MWVSWPLGLRSEMAQLPGCSPQGPHPPLPPPGEVLPTPISTLNCFPEVRPMSSPVTQTVHSLPSLPPGQKSVSSPRFPRPLAPAHPTSTVLSSARSVESHLHISQSGSALLSRCSSLCLCPACYSDLLSAPPKLSFCPAVLGQFVQHPLTMAAPPLKTSQGSQLPGMKSRLLSSELPQPLIACPGSQGQEQAYRGSQCWHLGAERLAHPAEGQSNGELGPCCHHALIVVCSWANFLSS